VVCCIESVERHALEGHDSTQPLTKLKVGFVGGTKMMLRGAACVEVTVVALVNSANHAATECTKCVWQHPEINGFAACAR
jgi:hypothetical protein